MKSVTGYLDAGHLLVCNFYFQRVFLSVENAADLEAGLRARVRYQVHNGRVGQQRLAALVLCDIRKQAVFNLVPFAGPRWQVADGNREACPVG